jgi:hypothetical protein
MEKVEIFFLFFFPSGGNVLLPPATSPCQGTKQILTVRATESTQEWTNPIPKERKNKKLLGIVNIISESKKRVSHRSAKMKLSNHGHNMLAEVSLSMT